jgi:hypothetical protein
MMTPMRPALLVAAALWLAACGQPQFVVVEPFGAVHWAPSCKSVDASVHTSAVACFNNELDSASVASNAKMMRNAANDINGDQPPEADITSDFDARILPQDSHCLELAPKSGSGLAYGTVYSLWVGGDLADTSGHKLPTALKCPFQTQAN